MAKGIQARLILSAAVVPLLGLGLTQPAHAAVKYWDRNDTAAGTGAAPAGTWDTTSTNWNTVADGTGAVTTWAAGDSAVFSAGADAAGAFTVTIATGTIQSAAAVTVDRGTITFAPSNVTGTKLDLGSGTLTINAGATVSQNGTITHTGGGVVLNGGTLKNNATSNAGTFYTTTGGITLGTGGGTLDYSGSSLLSIYSGVISGAAGNNLTKTGIGVLALTGTNTYAGQTIINGGEIRVRTSNNVLPTATVVTVNSGGVLNLNGLSQQIGSLTGVGNVGTGNGTLTINGSTSTTFSGALKNFANAGAGAVTTGNGKLVKSGSGVITFAGQNDITGSVTLSAGGITVASGGSLAGAIADLNVNGGTLTLNNAAQTIENFNGTGGTVALGTGHVLTTEPVANATFAGTITGAGGLTKANTSATIVSLTLTGNNTYTGPTTITGGSIVANATTGQALGGTGSLAISATAAFILGKSDQVKNTAGVTLGGGTFNTGGFSEGSFDGSGNGVAGVGALAVSSNSIVDLGGSAGSVLAFVDSSAAAWGGVLSVYNYTGTPGVGGGADRLYFGSSAAGLTPAQLAQIKFYSDSGTTQVGDSAAILSTGEVVPATAAVPEPGSIAVLGLGAMALAGRRRRRA